MASSVFRSFRSSNFAFTQGWIRCGSLDDLLIVLLAHQTAGYHVVSDEQTNKHNYYTHSYFWKEVKELTYHPDLIVRHIWSTRSTSNETRDGCDYRSPVRFEDLKRMCALRIRWRESFDHTLSSHRQLVLQKVWRIFE